jgi:hypothetical protein
MEACGFSHLRLDVFYGFIHPCILANGSPISVKFSKAHCEGAKKKARAFALAPSM